MISTGANEQRNHNTCENVFGFITSSISNYLAGFQFLLKLKSSISVSHYFIYCIYCIMAAVSSTEKPNISGPVPRGHKKCDIFMPMPLMTDISPALYDPNVVIPVPIRSTKPNPDSGDDLSTGVWDESHPATLEGKAVPKTPASKRRKKCFFVCF